MCFRCSFKPVRFQGVDFLFFFYTGYHRISQGSASLFIQLKLTPPNQFRWFHLKKRGVFLTYTDLKVHGATFKGLGKLCMAQHLSTKMELRHVQKSKSFPQMVNIARKNQSELAWQMLYRWLNTHPKKWSCAMYKKKASSHQTTPTQPFFPFPPHVRLKGRLLPSRNSAKPHSMQ